MRTLEKDLACAIRSDSSVLLSGERGAGKKFVARAIHQRSHRRSTAFVIARCQDFAASLTEPGTGSETAFPFTRGLSTLETQGTLLIDAIQESAEPLQRQLLQFIAEEKTIGSDLRIMTTTSVDLFERVRSNQFRSDLFYHLNVVHLLVPALRDRPEDIPILFDHYLPLYARAHTPRLSAAACQWLVAYPWPGNVAELKAAAETMAVQDLARPIELGDLPSHVGPFNWWGDML
jgi:DNA-binding NtrC family response regulator